MIYIKNNYFMLLLGTEFFIAIRYLKAKRKEKFISITAMFSFIGIMLGVAVLIIVMSIMNGFREELVEKIIGINSHITILPKYESKYDYELMIENIKTIKDVVYVNPSVEGQAMFIGNDRNSGGIVKAIKFKDLNNKTNVYNSLSNKNTLVNFDEENGIIIGKNLANILDVSLGDKIKIISPETNSTIIGNIPKMKTYEIVDIFQSGLYEYDSMTIFIPFKLGQLQFNSKNAANTIEVFLKDVNLSNEVKIEINNVLKNFDYSIIDWKESNASFIEALNIERTVMFLILSLIILIATFNIISSLTMLVMDKRKQIALLKTIGMNNNSIMRIFFISGSLIGFLGTTIGVFIGVVFSMNIQRIKMFLENTFNVNLFNPTVYYLTQLPSKLMIKDVLFVVLLSLILSFLATIYPARKAAKIKPAESLRYE